MLADLLNTSADSEVVVTCSYDQVGPGDRSFFTDFIVVNESAARSLDHADTFESVHTGSGARVGLENADIVQQHFDLFECMDDFDQSCVVIEECAVCDHSESLV